MAGVRAKPHDHRFPGDARDKGDIRDSVKLSGGNGVASLPLSLLPLFLSLWLPEDRAEECSRETAARRCRSWEVLLHGRSSQAFGDRVHVGLASLGIGFRLLFPEPHRAPYCICHPDMAGAGGGERPKMENDQR